MLASRSLCVKLLVFFVAVASLAVRAGLADDADYSEILRDRFGFNPLKQEPLVVLYRMDQAGNRDGVLEKAEVPAGAEQFVDQVLAESDFSLRRPIRLLALAVARQLHGRRQNESPLRSFVIAGQKDVVAVTNTDHAAQSHNSVTYSESFLLLYDADGNGVLSSDEWERIGNGWSEADRDGDGKLSVEELTLRFDDYHLAALDSLLTQPREIASNARALAINKSFDTSMHPRNARSVLLRIDPKRLPDWFVGRDANGDGQLLMAEYATEWTEPLVAEFRRYDLNDDGVITARELVKVLNTLQSTN